MEKELKTQKKKKFEEEVEEEEEDDYEEEDDDQVEEGEEGEEEDELEAEVDALARLKGVKKERTPVLDENGLQQKLEDIKLKMPGGNPVAWIETLVITGTEPVTLENARDDTKRELVFYEKAVAAAKEALKQLDELGVRYKRPTDYFAEMLKSDEHMKRIKDKLFAEKKRMEQSEEKRKQREMKKYSKQVQVEKKQEREKKKKEDLAAIAKWRKGIKTGGAGDVPVELEDNNEQTGGKKRKAESQKKGKSAKRVKKDQKYGFGGKKRGWKRNDKESFEDMSQLGSKKGKRDIGDNPRLKHNGRSKRPSGGKKPNRPGKNRRRQNQK